MHAFNVAVERTRGGIGRIATIVPLCPVPLCLRYLCVSGCTGAKVVPAMPMYNQLLKRPFDPSKDTLRIKLSDS